MFNSSNKSYEVITNETEERKMNTNALAMMYETASGESRLIDENSSPIMRTAYLLDSIVVDQSISPIKKSAVTKNRTFNGDIIFIRNAAYNLWNLFKSKTKINEIIQLLHDMDEFAERWHRFLYLGWWDITTLPPENSNVSVNSAILSCEVSGFNPIGKWVNIAQCTMYLYETDAIVPFKSQSCDVPHVGKYSFDFSGLKANTQYTYKPILTASYYENIAGINTYVDKVDPVKLTIALAMLAVSIGILVENAIK